MDYKEVQGFDVAEVGGASYRDFQEMVNRGCKFVVIRSSYGLYSADSMFTTYCQWADELGLEKMAYHYSYARNDCDALQEARNCAKIIADSGVGLSMIWYDVEEYAEESTSKCRTFLDNVGLNCGIYANWNFLTNYIDWRSLGCAVWNAQTPNDDIGGMMWQYELDVPIIDGSVDLDIKRVPV